MLRKYDWGIAMVDYEHPSDRTKKLNPPKVSLLYGKALIGVWDNSLSAFETIRTVVPWTFRTRAEARHVAGLERRNWREIKKVKFKVVKFKTVILENNLND